MPETQTDSMLHAVYTPEVMELVSRIREGRTRMDLMQINRARLSDMERHSLYQSLRSVFDQPSLSAADIEQIIDGKGDTHSFSVQRILCYRNGLIAAQAGTSDVLRANDIVQLHVQLSPASRPESELSGEDSAAPIPGDNPHRYIRRRYAQETLLRAQRALEEPCRAYHYAILNASIDPLIAIAALAVDYWAISPFSVLNRSTLSVLIQKLLFAQKYNVFRYISFDAMFMDDDHFYAAMRNSTIAWRPCQNDYLPFTLYFLRIIAKAYDAFFVQLGEAPVTPPSKQQRLRSWVTARTGPFTKRMIAASYPDISLSTIEVVLHELLQEGQIVRTGAGRGAGYRIV